MKKTITILSCALLLGSAVSAQTAPPNYVPQNGLVGWWPFSGNAGDQSGLSNNGNVYGAVLTTDRAGNAASAYTFDGSSSYIEVPDAASLRVRKLTMAAWVYSTNPSLNVYDMRDEIIYKARKHDAYGEAFSMRMGASSAVKIGSNCQAGVGWQITWFNNQFAPMGSWTHLCTTFDGSYMRNYINGQQVEAVPISGLIDSCVGSNLRFGYAHDLHGKAWTGPFMGKIDDIGIWNRALSTSEVSELHGGAPVAGPSGDQGPGGDTIVTNGLAQVADLQMTMTPNPAHNTVVLTRSSVSEPLQVRIADLMGRVVLQETFASKIQTLSINGTLAGGLYLVTVSDVQGALVFRQKLVVE